MNADKINLNILGTKAQSKVEMYRLLTVDVGLYLPSQRETSIYFIRDIIANKKRVAFVLNIIVIIGIMDRECQSNFCAPYRRIKS